MKVPGRSWFMAIEVESEFEELTFCPDQMAKGLTSQAKFHIAEGNGRVAFSLTAARMEIPDVGMLMDFRSWWEAQTTPEEAVKKIPQAVLLAELRRRIHEDTDDPDTFDEQEKL